MNYKLEAKHNLQHSSRIKETESLDKLIENCQTGFSNQFEENCSLISYAPGRINVLGEHTDYNNGLSLSGAINRWVVVGISKRRDRLVKAFSSNFNQLITYDPNSKIQDNKAWRHFIEGGCRIMDSVYNISSGYNLYIIGNVPIGGGVSSSAALCIALLRGIAHINQIQLSDKNLATLASKVEHQDVNVKSGLLDQYSSVWGQKGHLLSLDFKYQTCSPISFKSDQYAFLITDSKVKRALANTAYTDRVQETSLALEMLKEEFISIANFRDIEEKHLGLISELTPRKRLRHYISENERVIKGVGAITKGDYKFLGELLNESHDSLKNDYEVSCNEIDFLTQKLRDHDGCLGSRIMGGGFGGCCISIVKVEQINAIIQATSQAYEDHFELTPDFFLYDLVDGANVITQDFFADI